MVRSGDSHQPTSRASGKVLEIKFYLFIVAAIVVNCSLTAFYHFGDCQCGDTSSEYTLKKSVDTNVAIPDALEKLDCLASLEEEGQLTKEDIQNFGNLLCENSKQNILQLAKMIRQHRITIQRYERKEYLHSLRSYRLSGLVCNDHLDKSLPAVSSEAAFKCLTRDYQRKACMGGRVEYPNSCSAFRSSDAKTGSDMLHLHGPYTDDTKKIDCDESKANCRSQLMGKPGSSIAKGQLSEGMAEAEVLAQRSDGRPIWTRQVLDYLLGRLQANKDISPGDHQFSHPALQRAMEAADIQNKRVLVIGSISPWVESLAIHLGASIPTMTVDYNQPLSRDPRLSVQNMSELMDDVGTWPVVVSYSSVEHDGQGRYGDPLDPNGDLAAMQEIYLKLDPGGVLLLGVPFGEGDKFIWYSERKYGAARLPLLVQGYEYNGLATKDESYAANENFLFERVRGQSPVLILKKPGRKKRAKSGMDVLDRSTPGGLKCNHLGLCGKMS